METVAIIKLKQPAFLTVPGGRLTSEDTGVQIYSAGENILVKDDMRRAYSDAGIAFDVLHEAPLDQFMAALKEYAEAVMDVGKEKE